MTSSSRSISRKTDSIRILDFSEGSFSLKQLLAQYKPARVLAFGVDAAALKTNLNPEPYQLRSVGGCRLVFSHDLQDLLTDEELKKQLWAALKVLFGIQ